MSQPVLKEDGMSAVIDIKAWKATHAPKAAPLPPSAGEMVYFCTACDSERFRIFESGVVRCAQCNAALRSKPSAPALSIPFFLPLGALWFAPFWKGVANGLRT